MGIAKRAIGHRRTFLNVLAISVVCAAAAFWFTRSLSVSYVSEARNRQTESFATQETNALARSFSETVSRLGGIAKSRVVAESLSGRPPVSGSLAELNGDGKFAVLDVVDLSGKITLSSDASRIGDTFVREWVERALSGEDHVSLVTEGMGGRPLVGGAVPVRREGVIVGAVAGQYSASDIFSSMERARHAGAADDVFFTDEFGVVAYASDKAFLDKIVGPANPDVFARASARWREAGVSVNETAGALQPNIEAYDGVKTFADRNPFSGDERFYTLAKTGLFPHFAVFSVNASTIAAEANKLLFPVFFALFAAFALMLATFRFFFNRLLGPFEKITDFARRIVRGEYGGELAFSPGTDRTFVELGGALRVMAADVQNLRHHLEVKVKEQTKALSDKIGELEDARAALLNVLIDLEDSKRRIEEEVARESAIFRSMESAVIVVDANMKITFVNASYERMFGHFADEIVGKDYFDVFHAEEEDGTPITPNNSRLARAIMTGAGGEGKYLAYRKNGAKFPISAVVSPILMHEKVVGGTLVANDVTEERRLEDARISFISTTAHQLRTPLTAISWFVEMLLDGTVGDMTPPQKELGEKTYASVKRMVELVNLLLQSARVESGRVRIVPVPINPAQLFAEVIETMKAAQREKDQKVELHSTIPQDLAINIDKDYIWQVAQNLVSNALRYSPGGTIVSVDVEDRGIEVLCSVTDLGIGIPKDLQGQIFQKFYRAPNAIRAVPEGSGLGLSLVKTLVEGWHGRIWFESYVGKGTTFYFTIPKSGMRAKEGEVGLKVV